MSLKLDESQPYCTVHGSNLAGLYEQNGVMFGVDRLACPGQEKAVAAYTLNRRVPPPANEPPPDLNDFTAEAIERKFSARFTGSEYKSITTKGDMIILVEGGALGDTKAYQKRQQKVAANA